jgi:TonB family protein
METISRSLLTFLLNSIWQIPLAAATAALVCRALRHGPASHRHAVWVAALASAILLPLASVRSVRSGQAAPTPQFAASLADVATAKPALLLPAQAAPGSSTGPASRTVSFAETTATIVLGAWFLFVLFRVARLAWASIRTVQIRGTAKYSEIPGTLDRVWIRCQEAFGLANVPLLISAQVSGPVAAGRAIILPESLLAEPSEDVLTTVVGHEMAHLARRDFGCNLFYELLQAPIGFHPAVWLIRREIERTREMACDELVTHRLIDAGIYARSIMSIATGMMALPRPGYTLGVFDGDILEARIRRLVERPAANLKRARLMLATGLSALGLCAVIASSLALTARAQDGAHAVMKQAEAAYNRGDYKEAAGQFENAVKLEPGNLNAKLLLAHALLQDYVPGSGADNPLVLHARQQYLDVLALEPGNKAALQGLMILHTNTKQFAEAHEWALKAIQADASDKGAYYTAAFVDWAMTYPDYANARTAAGMQPQDPGIIADAGLRQIVRTKHGAQIEDGFRMLQIALQLDPGYSDAMAYMNLLYRIEAGIADTQAQYTDFIARADSWVTQALAAKRGQAQNPRPQSGPPTGPLDVDAPVPAPSTASLALPPPPPPPPPPGSDNQFVRMEAPGAIRIPGNVQQAMLVRQVPPVYPAAARLDGISGVVRLSIVIAKDGTVRRDHISVASSAGLLLDEAALDAVKRWVYRPTLLNGEPVEVVTTVEVNFAPAGQ